jgi:protein PsiE
MVGVFYKENRIPVTLPIIIAITALTRLIVLNTKGLDGINILYEATGILLLALAALVMSKKDELSLKKLEARKKVDLYNVEQ